ncbi:MAG TPA: DUF5694 domain-containing protein [Blastocatellia bacterium]|nr:DUF5694 domain-containing protein [Blastocatellia bacterium]
MNMLFSLGILISLMAQSPASNQAKAAEARKPIQVIVVGTFHMDNPGQDMVNPGIKDVLGARRQKEILEVVSRLQRFNPTKIALESTPESTKMQERLDGYLSGSYSLTPDERDQIGLRLAKDGGLKKVYGVDFKMDLPMQETFDWAGKNGQGEAVEQIMTMVNQKLMPALNSDFIEKHSVLEILNKSNQREADELSNQLYLMMLKIGKDSAYPGADTVSRWYERNLKIAANITRIAEPGDRIVVIIGAGHGKLLREFLAGIPGIEVVPTGDYLKP